MAPAAAATPPAHLHHPHHHQAHDGPGPGPASPAPAALHAHAIVIPFPAQGHIAPLLHLSLRLALHHGFAITFVNTQFNHPLLLRHLSPLLRRLRLHRRFRLVEVFDTRDTGHTTGCDSIVELCATFYSLLPQFEELAQSLITSPSATHPPLSLVISDLYLYFTLDLASKFSLPHMAFWTASAGTLASVLAINRGHRPNPDGPAGQLLTWIPGVPPLKPTEINGFLQSYDPSDLMYNVFLEPYQRLNETNFIVFNTFDELEHESLEALRAENPHVFTVGPLLPPAYFRDHVYDDETPGHAEDEEEHEQSASSLYHTAAMWVEDHSCLEWLGQQATGSVLYVSFGSIAILTREQFEELALGLEASGWPLLWVIRPDLMHGEEAMFPQGYVERVKGRVCFVEWAPQLQVLAHPAVGGFLTHCGWNSTLESITAGVPVLGWPYFADQMLNSRCCVDGWGVGLAFDSDPLVGELVGRDEVERKVRELMWTRADALRERALYWRDAARGSVRLGSGSSARSWGELLEAIAGAEHKRRQQQQQELVEEAANGNKMYDIDPTNT